MKKERLATGGAVVAAFAASLCCIGPLLFVVLGLGTFGAATAFESARPYLLGAAVLLLAFGFYRAYFRRVACAPGEACATKPVSHASRIVLWVASVMVLAFALSPYYAGSLVRRVSGSPNTQNAPHLNQQQQVSFKVTGMTCAGCEMTIKVALERTPGVRSAEVNYERSEAVVVYDANITTPEKLRDAINQTGYKVEQ
jgi:mercuric ion transport protein